MKITGRIELTGRGLFAEPYASPADDLDDRDDFWIDN